MHVSHSPLTSLTKRKFHYYLNNISHSLSPSAIQGKRTELLLSHTEKNNFSLL